MASQPGIRRVIRIPLSTAIGNVMQGLYQQVLPLILSDANGPMAWFNNQYLPDSSAEFTIVEFIMTAANDATFMAQLPSLLASAGLASVQTYSVSVTVGY